MTRSMVNFRPSTAPSNSFAKRGGGGGGGRRKKSSYKDRFKQKIFKDNYDLEKIPEAIQNEKFGELENAQDDLIYQKDYIEHKLKSAKEKN